MSFNKNTDPFEEFEFKPLTEGLGFHRNKDNSRLTEKKMEISSNLEFRNPNLQFQNELPSFKNTKINRPQINIPTIEDDSIAKAQSAVNEILKNLNHKKQSEELLAKNKKKLVWKNTTPSLLAGFLDSMLITAGFLLALIAMLTITKVDLISNISNPGNNYIIWLATSALLASVTLIYMVVCRTYMGYTPGEWAFDQRCGTELQQASPSYILKVTFRTLVVITTGFLPIVLISMILKNDFMSLITGLQIQKQTYA